MTVIRAPSDDEAEAGVEDKDKAVQPVQAKGSVTKAVGRSINYLRRALGLKKKRKARRTLRSPPGFKATKNPFFNYLRHLQVELQGMSAAEVAREGGRRWRHMTDKDKLPYRQMAQRASRARAPRRRSSSASPAARTPRFRRSRTRTTRRKRSRTRSRSSKRKRNRGG